MNIYLRIFCRYNNPIPLDTSSRKRIVVFMSGTSKKYPFFSYFNYKIISSKRKPKYVLYGQRHIVQCVVDNEYLCLLSYIISSYMVFITCTLFGKHMN